MNKRSSGNAPVEIEARDDPVMALHLRRIGKRYSQPDAQAVLRNVSLDIPRGQRHALIGPNGAGKTTLFDIASGRTAASAGAVFLHGEDVTPLAPHLRAQRGLARSFQITSLFPHLSVLGNLECAVLASDRSRMALWHSPRRRELRERTEAALETTGLTAHRDHMAAELSYAEQRALELGVTVAGGASVILLDEPTAGMSDAETQSAIDLIRRVTEGRTLFIIEHDMNVVFNLADRVSVLVRGELIMSDTPPAVRDDARVRESYLGSATT